MIDIESLPLVSIVITSFNRENWIAKAIESSLGQDYSNLEIIISDNKSTDNSGIIIKSFCADPRIRYHQNEQNIGMLANFKYATEKLAKGELITYVSSDDYLVNNSFVSEAVLKFKEYKTLVAFSGVSKNYYWVSKTEKHNSAYDFKINENFFKKIIKGKDVFTAFQYAHILNFGGSVFYKKDITELDIFRENNTTYFDLQAILLLALQGDFYFSDKVSYIQTFHDANTSMAYANAEKSLINLSFAEQPFEKAAELNAFKKENLDAWYYNILKPFIFNTSVNFLRTDKNEYKKFIAGLSKKYPAIFNRIMRDKKLKILKVIYSNKSLSILYKKLKSIPDGNK